MGGIFYKGIHQPELEGLDVLRLKVGVVELAHDAAPTAGGVLQPAARVNTSTVGRRCHIVVVRTLLLGIVRQVELIDGCRLTCREVLVGKHLLLGNAAGIGGRLVVARDVAGTVIVVEVATDAVPSQFGSVEAIGQPRTWCRLGEHRHCRLIVLRCAGHEPRRGGRQADAALRTLKVIHIRHTALLAARTAHAWDEVGKLGRQGQVRRCLGVDARQQVDQFCDERHLVAVVDIQAPDSVAGGLVAKVILLCQRLLVQVHHRGSKVEVGLELVVQVQAQHALGGHAE